MTILDIALFLAKEYYVLAYESSGMGHSGVREAYPDEVRLQELMEVTRTMSPPRAASSCRRPSQ